MAVKGTDAGTQTEDPWNEHFMKIACLAALRSKDPSTPVGACVIKGQKVLGIGYNSMPYMSNKDNDKYFPWSGSSGDAQAQDSAAVAILQAKDPYVVHAAINAITNRTIDSLDGCSIYVTLHPDEECANAIITSGIEKVYYSNYKRNADSAHEGIEEGKKILQHNSIERILMMTVQDTPDEVEDAANNLDPEQKLAKRIAKSRKSGPGSKAAENYISWEMFFIEIARLAAKRPNKGDTNSEKIQGACIVSPEKQVISVAASGYPDSLKVYPERGSAQPYITHAEARAIVGGPKVRGCTLYTTLYPCHKCAQLIVQSGITNVVYEKEFDDNASKIILKNCLGEENIKRFAKKDSKGGPYIVSKKEVKAI